MMKNINMYNIKKWYNMVKGNSIYHVNQGVGKIYSKHKIEGYYNDLTEKVTKGDNLDIIEIPKTKIANGEIIEFPIAIFQYGLGSYDLYLMEKKEIFLEKFRLTADWAVDNQEESGAWNTFSHIYPDNPYSAMSQGEGCSLLIRAYITFEDERYLNAAKNAIEFMLKSIKDGGTTLYNNNDVFFQESTHLPTILNGWIFALFGLYDYVKLTNDIEKKEILNKSLDTLERTLNEFDNGYWSMYDNSSMITSPFYHDLHIVQLRVLNDIFGVEAFKTYSDIWNKYRNNLFNKRRAFLVKALQKILER